MDRKTLTPQQVAQVYGFPVQTLANWRWLGEGPSYIKIGKKIFYRIEDMDRYLNDHLITTRDTADA